MVLGPFIVLGFGWWPVRSSRACIHNTRVIYPSLNPKLASSRQNEAENCVRVFTGASVENLVYFTGCIRPNDFQERLHTIFPLTQVLTTYPSSSNTVKSASAPGLSVPFRFSIPKHLCNSFQHNSRREWAERSTLQG